MRGDPSDPQYEPSVCEERRRRIRVAVAAYAYEVMSDPIMTDAEYDALALKIDVSARTGNEELDEFFKKEFDPSTGSWVHGHPELHEIVKIYRRMKERFSVDFKEIKRKQAILYAMEERRAAASEPDMMDTLFG